MAHDREDNRRSGDGDLTQRQTEVDQATGNEVVVLVSPPPESIATPVVKPKT